MHHVDRLALAGLGALPAVAQQPELGRAPMEARKPLAMRGLEAIDRSLLDIEKFLDDALLARTEKNELKRAEKEVASQLREYKAGMEKEAYEQTFRIMLLKRLREDYGIPRMGLFYL